MIIDQLIRPREPLTLKSFGTPGIEKTFTAHDVIMEQLDLGGRVGRKYKLVMRNPRASRSSQEAESQLVYFAKYFPFYSRTMLLNHTKTYRQLHLMGFPVPDVVRLLHHNGKNFLVMSDMTENGRYWIWGYNDKPEPGEFDNLQEMNLTFLDLQIIYEKAQHLAMNANQKNFLLNWWYFHIRKDKTTHKVDVVLLDIDPKDHLVKNEDEDNLTEVDEFMRKLLERMHFRQDTTADTKPAPRRRRN